MNFMQKTERLLGFIKEATSPYHAVYTAERLLSAAGFEEIQETSRFNIKKGGKYYIKRAGNALIFLLNCSCTYGQPLLQDKEQSRA